MFLVTLFAFGSSPFPVYLPDPWLFCASAAMVLIGLVLFYLAMRGRRIDDHPVCRRCRFDLVGLPADANRCSECGADLKRRRAVRVGNRQRRWGWMLLGSLLILENGSWLSVQVRHMAADTDWNRYKPAWWLLSEARSGDSTAVARLVGKWEQGTLSKSQADELLRLMLAAQGDRKRTWLPQWGDTVEKMRRRRMVSDADWQKYWEQSYGLALNVGHSNKNLFIYYTESLRPGTRRRDYATRIDVKSATFDGKPLFPPDPVLDGPDYAQPPIIYPMPPAEQLGCRPHALQAVVDLYIDGEKVAGIPLKTWIEMPEVPSLSQIGVMNVRGRK
jgi:hypothetical protein